MAEELIVSQGTKEEMYETLLPQIASVIEDEPDLVANMANVSAMLADTFRHWWTGFYCVQGEELVLGPFQGPMACTRIRRGRGVCGTAWEQAKTIIVPDVEQFPGHIACSSLSRSEIVVPLFQSGRVVAVLDIDSKELNTFDAVDAHYLERLAELMSSSLCLSAKNL